MSSTWLLVLTVFNLIVLSVLTIQVFLKLKEKKEDLRLAKGLQLLQNKISILQDLSDKTDHQVHKIVQVIDKKSGDIQINMATIDAKIAHVEATLIRATEISKHFAQQMPPQNISEMKKTSLHVQAAKLANQGFSREQIMDKVDLNPAEIDLIFKVNKDQLQFAEDQLPGWVGSNTAVTVDNTELSTFGNLIKAQKATVKSTVTNSPTLTSALASSVTMPAILETLTAQPTTSMTTGTTTTASSTILNSTALSGQTGSSTVTPYVFKKIEPQKNKIF